MKLARSPGAQAFIVRVVAITLAGLLASSAAWALDLAEAYRFALDIDPVVGSVRASADAAQQRIDQARAIATLPSASGVVQLNKLSGDNNLDQNFTYNNRVYALNLAYPLYRPQGLNQLDQSKLQAQAGAVQVDQARQDLMVRVAQAYFDVLAADDALTTIRAQRRAITEQLAAARRGFEVGNTTITDQQEAQARDDLNVSQQLAAENDLAIRQAALVQLIGQPLTPLRRLAPSVELSSPQPAQERAWTDQARQSNLSVVQAQFASEVARREIERRRYGHYPTVDLVGGYQRQEGATPLAPQFKFNAASIGVQMNIPIYSGGAVEAQVREGASLLTRASNDLDNSRRQAEQTARIAFLGVNSGLGRVRALDAAERSSRLALESNQLGYQVGVRINIDVLNAQQQLYSTQRDLSRARYDVIVNGLRLRQSAGTLTADDLDAISRLLSAPDR